MALRRILDQKKKSKSDFFNFYQSSGRKKLIITGKKKFILLDMAKNRKKRFLDLFSSIFQKLFPLKVDLKF